MRACVIVNFKMVNKNACAGNNRNRKNRSMGF